MQEKKLKIKTTQKGVLDKRTILKEYRALGQDFQIRKQIEYICSL